MPGQVPSIEAFRRSYLIGTAIVWLAIIIATTAILAGTPYFAPMLVILGGGAVWFIVLVPGTLYRGR